MTRFPTVGNLTLMNSPPGVVTMLAAGQETGLVAGKYRVSTAISSAG
jgi:hypothetical protein